MKHDPDKYSANSIIRMLDMFVKFGGQVFQGYGLRIGPLIKDDVVTVSLLG